MKGNLVIIKKKDGVSYRVKYTSEKGKPSEAAVSGQAKCFLDVDATEGMEVEIELKNGLPCKVTIPGKAQIEGQAVQRTAAAPRNAGFHQGAGRNPGAAQRGAARTDATAPYNFISAQRPIGFDTAPDTSRFGGTIVCRLTALTPILVSGPQARSDNGPAERRFYTVGGTPTIPGSSLKGMIRSAIEVLSCAPLGDGLSERKIPYRDVNSADTDSPYGRRFRSGEEELCAGMLLRHGSERTVVPCSWMRLDGREFEIKDCDRLSAVDKYKKLSAAGIAPLDHAVHFKSAGRLTDSGDPIAELTQSTPGALRGIPVFTGGLSGKKFLDYVFYERRKDDGLPLPPVVWRDFTDQLSPAQEELMKYFGDLDSKSGFPIFYLRRRTTNGFEITAIGLSRYFRLVAPAQPRDVADAITDGVAMPERIFGRAGQTSGSSLAGRVFFHAATPCQPHNPPIEFPSNGNLVAGNPSATAVSLYLEQVAGSVHLRCGIVHQNEGLTTFASPDPVLRGRKLYWHRQQPVAPPPPNANPKVQARYFPLPAQTVFEFSLTFERLDAIELGALVEALELPVGAAHKLGLGKPFGLGSVRVDLDLNRSRVQADRARYGSIRSRFGQQGDCSKILGECRMAFRNAVVARRGDRNFEDLTHVREFRVMTNFVKPRDPKAIGYMALKADNQTVSYRMKPILPKPLEIPPATRCV